MRHCSTGDTTAGDTVAPETLLLETLYFWRHCTSGYTAYCTAGDTALLETLYCWRHCTFGDTAYCIAGDTALLETLYCWRHCTSGDTISGNAVLLETLPFSPTLSVSPPTTWSMCSFNGTACIVELGGVKSKLYKKLITGTVSHITPSGWPSGQGPTWTAADTGTEPRSTQSSHTSGLAAGAVVNTMPVKASTSAEANTGMDPFCSSQVIPLVQQLVL